MYTRREFRKLMEKMELKEIDFRGRHLIQQLRYIYFAINFDINAYKRSCRGSWKIYIIKKLHGFQNIFIPKKTYLFVQFPQLFVVPIFFSHFSNFSHLSHII